MRLEEIAEFIVKNHQPHESKTLTAAEHTVLWGPNEVEHRLRIRGKMTVDQVKVLLGKLRRLEDKYEVRDVGLENRFAVQSPDDHKIIEYCVSFSSKGKPDIMKERAKHFEAIKNHVINAAKVFHELG